MRTHTVIPSRLTVALLSDTRAYVCAHAFVLFMWRCGVAVGGVLGKCDSSRYPEFIKQKILCQPTAVSAMFADSEPIFPLCVCACAHAFLCVCVRACVQRALVPMVVCYWLVISVGNRSCYQAWHGDRRGWMMHGTGKLFRRKDNGATHTR